VDDVVPNPNGQAIDPDQTNPNPYQSFLETTMELITTGTQLQQKIS